MDDAVAEVQAAVEKAVSVEEQAITLLQALKAKLDAAIPGGDLPAAQLRALAAELGAETDKLSATVVADTPADPAA